MYDFHLVLVSCAPDPAKVFNAGPAFVKHAGYWRSAVRTTEAEIVAVKTSDNRVRNLPIKLCAVKCSYVRSITLLLLAPRRSVTCERRIMVHVTAKISNNCDHSNIDEKSEEIAGSAASKSIKP